MKMRLRDKIAACFEPPAWPCLANMEVGDTAGLETGLETCVTAEAAFTSGIGFIGKAVGKSEIRNPNLAEPEPKKPRMNTNKHE